MTRIHASTSALAIMAVISGHGLMLAEANGQAVPQAKEIMDNVFVLSTGAGNSVVLFGEDGPIVIGPTSPRQLEAVERFLDKKNSGLPAFAIVVDDDAAPQRGDGGWGAHGVVTVAHENLRNRIRAAAESDPAMAARLPTIGFAHVFQIAVNNDEIHAVHQAPGYSDADMIVHFEKRYFICLGNIFTTDGYPAINIDRGGSVEGLIASTNKFITMWEARPEYAEPIIPGRGPIGTMRDLRAYHDMLVDVRDRVLSMIKTGASLEEVIAARPTRSFDERWGNGPVAADDFVSLVYRSVRADSASN